jgi:hypothetical protein
MAADIIDHVAGDDGEAEPRMMRGRTRSVMNPPRAARFDAGAYVECPNPLEIGAWVREQASSGNFATGADVAAFLEQHCGWQEGSGFLQSMKTLGALFKGGAEVSVGYEVQGAADLSGALGGGQQGGGAEVAPGGAPPDPFGYGGGQVVHFGDFTPIHEGGPIAYGGGPIRFPVPGQQPQARTMMAGLASGGGGAGGLLLVAGVAALAYFLLRKKR